MGFNLGGQPTPITPVVANIPLVMGQMSQSMARDAEMLPRTMQVALQVGLIPTSFFRQIEVNRHTISRMLPFSSEPQKLDHDEKKRKEIIRGVIVTKTETSNDSHDKPKDDER